MKEKLELLEKVQQLDLERERLEAEKEDTFKNSPLADLKKQLGELEKKLSSLLEKTKKVSLEHKKAMGELELLEQKIATEEKRLYSGTVNNPKELKTINDEIASLEKRKEKQEDKFLEIALELEELEEAVAATEKSIVAKKKEVEEEERHLKEVEEKTRTQVEAFRSEAEKLRPEIPTEILKIYDSKRDKLAGKVVAHLKSGVCGGCNMELHAEELDKIMANPDKLAQCPSCQRLLLLQDD